MMKLRTSRHGFSLVEVMAASAIFLIAFVSLTGFMGMSTRRRAITSKHVSMTRLANQEYQRYLLMGYDALRVVPSTSFVRFDADGRKAWFEVAVTDNCSAPITLAGSATPLPTSALVTNPLSNVQTCCTGGVCCKALALQMQWLDTTKAPPHPWVTETYTGFVTKSCQ